MNPTFESKFGHAIRLLVGAVGGYLFVSGLMAILGAGLPLLGIARSESVLIGILIGFVTLIVVITWVVATKRFLLLSSLFFISAALMILIAPQLAVG